MRGGGDVKSKLMIGIIAVGVGFMAACAPYTKPHNVVQPPVPQNERPAPAVRRALFLRSAAKRQADAAGRR
jgi:hypothetical protein